MLILKKDQLEGLGELLKAVGHKFKSKYKKNGKWVYVYPNQGTRHGSHSLSKERAEVKAEHIHEGSSFAAGSGKGHYKIEKVENGLVTYHHDDVDGNGTRGKSMTISVEDFRARANYERKDAVKSHYKEGVKKRESILERARQADPEGKMGYVARAEKELSRWKEKHGQLDSVRKEKKTSTSPAKKAVKAPKKKPDHPPQKKGSMTKLNKTIRTRESELDKLKDKIAATLPGKKEDELKKEAGKLAGEIANLRKKRKQLSDKRHQLQKSAKKKEPKKVKAAPNYSAEVGKKAGQSTWQKKSQNNRGSRRV